MSLFKLFKKSDAVKSEQSWFARADEDGLRLMQQAMEGCHELGDTPLLTAWLYQLEEEALASQLDGGYVLAWDAVYAMQGHPEHQAPLKLLKLPPQAECTAVLASKGSLEDESFSISVIGWRGEDGVTREGLLQGPVLNVGQSTHLLSATAWALLQAVREFSRRPAELRTGHHHRLAWGRIRRLAQEAGARLDAFLTKTVVLTPEKLAIGLRRAHIGDDSVIEVQPTFEGAPEDWIERFDQHSNVQSRYDIPTADGIVQVVVSPKVRTVLDEIKRLTILEVEKVLFTEWQEA